MGFTEFCHISGTSERVQLHDTLYQSAEIIEVLPTLLGVITLFTCTPKGEATEYLCRGARLYGSETPRVVRECETGRGITIDLKSSQEQKLKYNHIHPEFGKPRSEWVMPHYGANKVLFYKDFSLVTDGLGNYVYTDTPYPRSKAVSRLLRTMRVNEALERGIGRTLGYEYKDSIPRWWFESGRVF